jgi:7-carboxy-7-deazaguanine synthase
MLKLSINETFVSVQGEGRYAGYLSFFIRTSGCDLTCSFCDTDHQLVEEKAIDELVTAVDDACIKHVVITGGEPTMHLGPLHALTHRLTRNGHTVQIETNGFVDLDPANIDAWITLSPKNPNHNMQIGRVCEVKLLIGPDGPVNGINIDSYDVYKHILRYFQPIDPGVGSIPPLSIKPIDYLARVQPAVNKILALQRQYPEWAISLQLHKLYGWR